MANLSGQLDMHRVFGLVPFYVLGLMLRPEHFALLTRPAARVLGTATLTSGLLVVFLVGRHLDIEWLYWRSSHATLGVDNVTGTLIRMGMLLCSTVLVVAFLAVVPAHRTWFTGLGATTLYAYLLHGFVPKLMTFMGWYDAHWLHSIPGTVALAAAGMILATGLCTPPVQRAMRWALEPSMAWAFIPLRRPGSRLQR
jgi:fucose 4-O-acetylase-like acetyltransferase